MNALKEDSDRSGDEREDAFSNYFEQMTNKFQCISIALQIVDQLSNKNFQLVCDCLLLACCTFEEHSSSGFD